MYLLRCLKFEKLECPKLGGCPEIGILQYFKIKVKKIRRSILHKEEIFDTKHRNLFQNYHPIDLTLLAFSLFESILDTYSSRKICCQIIDTSILIFKKEMHIKVND